MGFGRLRLSWVLSAASFVAVVVATGLYTTWLLAPVQLPRPPGGEGDYFPAKTPSILCRERPEIRQPMPTWRRIAEWRGDHAPILTTPPIDLVGRWHILVRQHENLPGALGGLSVDVLRPASEGGYDYGCSLPRLYGSASGWFEVEGRGRFILDVTPLLVDQWEILVFDAPRAP